MWARSTQLLSLRSGADTPEHRFMQWLGFGFRSAPVAGINRDQTLGLRSVVLSWQITISQPSGPNHPAVAYCPAVTTAQPMPRCEAVLLLPVNNTVVRRSVQADPTIFLAAHRSEPHKQGQ
jgi:hypothetical protein